MHLKLAVLYGGTKEKIILWTMNPMFGANQNWENAFWSWENSIYRAMYNRRLTFLLTRSSWSWNRANPYDRKKQSWLCHCQTKFYIVSLSVQSDGLFRVNTCKILYHSDRNLCWEDDRKWSPGWMWIYFCWTICKLWNNFLILLCSSLGTLVSGVQ